jgi:hypothetical protein
VVAMTGTTQAVVGALGMRRTELDLPEQES